MTVTKNQSDKQKAEKNNLGGAREESKLIKKYADKWCKDNGNPVRKRKRRRYHTANFIYP